MPTFPEPIDVLTFHHEAKMNEARCTSPTHSGNTPPDDLAAVVFKACESFTDYLTYLESSKLEPWPQNVLYNILRDFLAPFKVIPSHSTLPNRQRLSDLRSASRQNITK